MEDPGRLADFAGLSLRLELGGDLLQKIVAASVDRSAPQGSKTVILSSLSCSGGMGRPESEGQAGRP
jgi:hypothetical protein